jgi:hypothetical protein
MQKTYFDYGQNVISNAMRSASFIVFALVMNKVHERFRFPPLKTRSNGTDENKSIKIMYLIFFTGCSSTQNRKSRRETMLPDRSERIWYHNEFLKRFGPGACCWF